MRKYAFTKPSLGVLVAVMILACGGTAYPSPAGDGPAGVVDSLGHDLPGARVLRLESIEITGNKRTPETIVLRYIGIETRDEVTVDRLDNARARLIDTGYFSTVELSTRPGAERGAVVLVVEVEERGFPSFETGFGYDDLYGWFLTLLGLRFDNTFGIESQFRMGLRLGFRIAGVDAEWETPIPRDGGFGFFVRGHIYNQKHIFFGSGPPWQGTAWKRFDQDIARFGAETGLRYRIGGATRFSFGLHFESSEPDSTFTGSSTDEDFKPEDLPVSLQSDLGKNLTTGAFFRVIRDTRDSDAYPLSGSFTLLTLQINNTFLGGDRIFTKAVGDVRKHISVGDKTVWSSRVKAGVLTDDAPYYDRFYIGGNYTIRGFEEWSLSPARGDDGFWLSNHGSPNRPLDMVFDWGFRGWAPSDSMLVCPCLKAGRGIRSGFICCWVSRFKVRFSPTRMVVCKTAFLTLFSITVLFWAPVYGAGTDERPVIRSASVSVVDGVIVSDVTCDGLFSDQIVGTVQSGLPAVVELLYSLVNRNDKPIAAGLHIFELRYDVWEDFYVVESVDSTRRYATLSEMIGAIENLHGIAVIPVESASANTEYAVKFSIAMHPLRGREKQRIAGWVGDNVKSGSQESWHEQVLNLNDLIRHFFSREKNPANRSPWYRTEYFDPRRLPVGGEVNR